MLHITKKENRYDTITYWLKGYAHIVKINFHKELPLYGGRLELFFKPETAFEPFEFHLTTDFYYKPKIDIMFPVTISNDKLQELSDYVNLVMALSKEVEDIVKILGNGDLESFEEKYK